MPLQTSTRIESAMIWLNAIDSEVSSEA